MDADLIVVGGGAAGFFAAITAAGRGARVIILERGGQALAKVRISGGGRCNVTNACLDPAELIMRYPRGGVALRGPLTRFGPRETMGWFTTRGVVLKSEPDGRVFPRSDDAGEITGCLEEAAHRAGVQTRLRASVRAVTRAETGFTVELSNGDKLSSARVLLATGGAAHGHALAAALGHTIVPPVPSLFTFEVADTTLTALSGLSVPVARVRLTAPGQGRETGHEQTGPVLITHWGLSGPAILRLSAWAARALAEAGYRAELTLAWLSRLSPEAIEEALTARKRSAGAQHVVTQSPFGELPARLWRRLVIKAGILEAQTWAKLPRDRARALAAVLTGERLLITGKGPFKEEFVTAGGVDLDEVDFRTMESKRCPGLFLAGEILDIDGLTGGFNLQAAWTTGAIAGGLPRAPAQA